MLRFAAGVFVAGVAVAVAAFAVVGLLIVQLGLFDARASTPHSVWFAWATHTTMINRSKRGAAKLTPPPHFTADEVMAGFLLYDRDCAMCHGGPGFSRARFVEGMNPPPPYLLDIAHKWSPARLYWVVGNGVKMTGMPAWNTTYTRGEVWDAVAFLEALPNLSAADYQRLKKRAAPAARPGAPPAPH